MPCCCTPPREPSKQWPEANWIALGQALAGDGLDLDAALGHRKPSGRAASGIAAALPRARVPERAPLDAVARLIAGAQFVVGVDTGLLHLAAALGVPLVAIFAGSKPGLTGPVGSGPIAVLGAQGEPPTVAAVRCDRESCDAKTLNPRHLAVSGTCHAAPARNRSCMWMMPTGLPASTTNSAVTLVELSISSVSLIS